MTYVVTPDNSYTVKNNYANILNGIFQFSTWVGLYIGPNIDMIGACVPVDTSEH